MIHHSVIAAVDHNTRYCGARERSKLRLLCPLELTVMKVELALVMCRICHRNALIEGDNDSSHRLRLTRL